MRLFANMQTVFAVGCKVACSVGMMLFNKMAVRAFPVECTLVAMQMACTAAVMVTCCWGSLRIGSLRDVLRWLVVVPFFAGTLVTNILALKHASMTLIIVLRVLSPLLSLAAERFYPEPMHLSSSSMGSILVMFAGAAAFTMNMPSAEFRHVHWVLLNVFFAVGDRLLERLMLARRQNPVDISITAATLLNNLAGQIPVLCVMLAQREFYEVPDAFRQLTAAGIVWVALSCAAVVGLSYVSVLAQSRISATSFLVLMNADKFLIIFIEAFCLGTRRLTHLQIFGACVAVAGSIAYSNSRGQGLAGRSRGRRAAGEKRPLVSKQPAAV